MKKFRFTLLTLLKIRQQQVENAQNNLLEANRYLQNSIHQLESLQIDLENLYKNLRHNSQRIDVEDLKKTYEYSYLIKSKIHSQKKLTNEAKVFVDQRRKEILLTRKNLRIIETLRDKKSIEWENKSNKEEDKLADDFSIMHFFRKEL